MKKNVFARIGTAVVVGCLSATVSAADGGTAAEARAMLEKTAAAIKANKATALSQITKGEAGFKDRDLYPFCGGPDGKFTAHPTQMGSSLKDSKSQDGDPVGAKIYAAAQEGAVSEVSYMWPKPGSTAPAKKVSLVTKIGDQVCAVGYYQ